MKKLRILTAILAISIIITPMSKISVQAKTQQEINNEIDANNKKIDALEAEKSEVKAKKNEEQSKLDQLQGELDGKNQLLNDAKEKVNQVKQQIDGLTSDIATVENDIKENKEQIEIKQKEKETKEEILGKRLRNVYKTNLSDQILYLLLESDSIGSLISNINSVTSLVKTDNKLIEEIKEIQIELEEKNTQLVKQEEELQVKKQEAEVAKIEQDKVAAEYEVQVAELQDLYAQRESIVSSLSEEERKIQNEIASYEEDNINLENYFSNNSTSSGGQVSTSGFMRPTSGPITSPFGNRTHPITGQQQSFHKGVDIAPAAGTPIVASKAGTVTTASYLSGYGNTVIIDHGDGTSTLYAHASSFAVSNGQKVSQGQTIAYVGSTGNSTGPHLHFEVRVNGNPVNPMNYIN